MKRIWIRAGETVHVEGIPFRVAEDAAMDCNPNNLKLLEHVRWTDAEPKAARPEAALTMPSESAIRLACGEMTAQEMRTVKAALQWFIYANNLRQPQKD